MMKDTSENTDILKLPGTISGDDRLKKQLTKYIEKDNKLKTMTNSSISMEDPFKVRDEKYMKFKYHHKHDQEENSYVDTFKRVYDTIAKTNPQLNNKDSEVDKKVQYQLSKYNPFTHNGSRNHFLSEYDSRPELNTMDPPKAQRYRKINDNSYKSLKVLDKPNTEAIDAHPISQLRETQNRSQLSKYDQPLNTIKQNASMHLSTDSKFPPLPSRS